MNPYFSDLLLSQPTRAQIEAFITSPGHALLISGRRGSGKITLARYIAASLLGVTPTKVTDHPYLTLVTKPENKNETPIAAVRDLSSKLSLRVVSSGNNQINRIVIFEEASSLSLEAQNALLKLLEEPPSKTLIILTSDSELNLLPTVISRTQRITITPPSLDRAVEFFSAYPDKDVTSAYRLSQGASELLDSLLTDKDNHSLKVGVAQAKEFISANTYQRLIQIQDIAKDKTAFVAFLDALARVLAALHEEYLKKGKPTAASRILATRKAVEAALNQSEENSNARLTSLALALNTKI